MKRVLALILSLYQLSVIAQVTFIVNSTPSKTPIKDTLFFTSSINNWKPCDKKYAFSSNNELFISTEIDSFEYKITRGSYKTLEVDSAGINIPPRFFTKSIGDKVVLKINGWRDIAPKQKSTVTKGVSFMPTNIEIPQLKRKRTIRMYFPPNYSSGKRFPVIYMFDGQNLFDETTSIAGEWGVDETLDSLYKFQGISCIVVGIYSEEKRRINEFTPWRNDSIGIAEGEKYADFIAKTLKPFIDNHYRTLPSKENTIVIGSTMGAQMSLWMSLEYPHIFGKVGVFSPKFSNPMKIFEKIKQSRQNKIQYFYLLSGTKAGLEEVYNTLKADSLLRNVGVDESYIKSKILKNDLNNESLWRREFGDAIRYLFN